MSETTAISWTDSTFNPWIGCQKVSPACDHCYAEADNRRFYGGANWGPRAPRRMTSAANWRKPKTWNRKAELSGRRMRVFCGSWMDVFDRSAPDAAHPRLWALIRDTPNLDWLLLTKRPQNIQRFLPNDWGSGYPNVWLGTTCEDRAHGLPRVDILRTVPAQVRFLSCEPLLEDLGQVDLFGIAWVIAGSESGRNARPCSLDWVRSLRDQCRAGGVAFHWKQHVVNGRKLHTPELDGRRWTEFPMPQSSS